MIRVRAIDYRGSVCDGPGIRTVVFLQGCKRHCPGCHNPETWSINAGRLVNARTLAAEISASSPTRKVTISGGEPLLQAEELAKLLEALKDEGFDIALYTAMGRKDVPGYIMAQIDYLKTGEYVEALRTTVVPYVGSTNQRFERIA